MNWTPGECKLGDMIRVKLGSIYHYGIFVNEDRVIQFGLPPLNICEIKAEEVVVCTSDIDVFSCGQIVEIAQFDRQERKKKFSAKKIVERAESMMGTGGYSLLHNNCEHFATWCVLGEKHCEIVDAAVAAWKEKVKETCACGATGEIIIGENESGELVVLNDNSTVDPDAGTLRKLPDEETKLDEGQAEDSRKDEGGQTEKPAPDKRGKAEGDCGCGQAGKK